MFAQIRAEQPVKNSFTTVQVQGAATRQQMRPLAENEIIIDVGGLYTGGRQ
jgi:hypothetical protein